MYHMDETLLSGRGVGSLVGGQIFDAYGAVTTFRICAGIAGILLVSYLVLRLCMKYCGKTTEYGGDEDSDLKKTDGDERTQNNGVEKSPCRGTGSGVVVFATGTARERCQNVYSGCHSDCHDNHCNHPGYELLYGDLSPTYSEPMSSTGITYQPQLSPDQDHQLCKDPNCQLGGGRISTFTGVDRFSSGCHRTNTPYENYCLNERLKSPQQIATAQSEYNSLYSSRNVKRCNCPQQSYSPLTLQQPQSSINVDTIDITSEPL